MNVIEVENVSKIFREKGKKFYALKNVTLNVRKEEIFGLLGPNGAGKTTLINIIIGILAQDSGTIKVFGQDISSGKDYLSKMNSVSGTTRFHWSLRPMDVLKIYSILYNVPKKSREKKIEFLFRFFGLHRIRHKKFYMLSTGEKMRLIFAKAMLNEPKLLILDEPTLGLDPDIAINVRKEIKKLNKKFGTTVMLTSHYMNEVEQLADSIAFINKGEIVDMGHIEKVKLKTFSTYMAEIKVKKLKNIPFLEKCGFKIRKNILFKELPLEKNISEELYMLVKKGFEIVDVKTKKPTLEDYFVKITGESDEMA